MSDGIETHTCLRCGVAFASSQIYLDYLQRRGVVEVVPALCPACYRRAGPWPKERGEIKWFNPRKRYGFIITEQGEEIFVHQERVIGDGRELNEGQAVAFHVYCPLKGPAAMNVEVVPE